AFASPLSSQISLLLPFPLRAPLTRDDREERRRGKVRRRAELQRLAARTWSNGGRRRGRGAAAAGGVGTELRRRGRGAAAVGVGSCARRRMEQHAEQRQRRPGWRSRGAGGSLCHPPL
ncbi:unnamed protein product, partial [Urochloa humidicola]